MLVTHTQPSTWPSWPNKISIIYLLTASANAIFEIKKIEKSTIQLVNIPMRVYSILNALKEWNLPIACNQLAALGALFLKEKNVQFFNTKIVCRPILLSIVLDVCGACLNYYETYHRLKKSENSTIPRNDSVPRISPSIQINSVEEACHILGVNPSSTDLASIRGIYERSVAELEDRSQLLSEFLRIDLTNLIEHYRLAYAYLETHF